MLPARGTKHWRYVDPSGGSEDSFTLAIAHRLDDHIVIDCVREVRPPFSPAAVVAVLLRSYKIDRLTGDRYGGEFPRELFRKHGIRYDLAKLVKSDQYRDLLPLLNSGSITLPNNDRLIAQIVGLERQVTRGGKDRIDHARSAHDDMASAVAGCAACAKSRATIRAIRAGRIRRRRKTVCSHVPPEFFQHALHQLNRPFGRRRRAVQSS